MGTLRLEPKQKSLMDPAQEEAYLKLLSEAKASAEDHHVYFDLEDDENPTQTKKKLMFVAEKANIDVTIRRQRGSRSLVFTFKKGGKGAAPAGARMSAEESRDRIIECLRNAPGPLKKNGIIKETGISSSTWNIRVKELLTEGIIERHGDRRDTTYTLAK